jgi:2-polyprenyl-6-methoxyphenol hydroxylase-like FAD-dependent oxidoreductase
VRAPWFAPRIREIVWSLAVRFERHMVSPVGRRNVWLAGDAAHAGSPVGIHSMNVGLCEAHDLASRIHEVLRGGVAIGEMDGYVAEHRREWQALFGGQPVLTFTANASPWARDNAQWLFRCAPAAGREARRLLSQLGIVVE